MGGAPEPKGCERAAEGTEFVPVRETGAGVVVRGREELDGTLIPVGSPTRIDEAVCVGQNDTLSAVVGQRAPGATGFIPKMKVPIAPPLSVAFSRAVSICKVMSSRWS